MINIKLKMIISAILAVMLVMASVFGIYAFVSPTLNEATPDEIVAATMDEISPATNDEVEHVEVPTESPTEKKKETTPPTEVIEVAEPEPETEPVVYYESEPYTELAEPESQEVVPNSDEDLLARLIYLESGSCSEYCQWLVGSTIINLLGDSKRLADIAYNYNVFDAYVVDRLNSCTPSSLSISVARRVLSGDRDPVPLAFRTDYYHDFGMPYTNVDNVYFSTF